MAFWNPDLPKAETKCKITTKFVNLKQWFAGEFQRISFLSKKNSPALSKFWLFSAVLRILENSGIFLAFQTVMRQMQPSLVRHQFHSRQIPLLDYRCSEKFTNQMTEINHQSIERQEISHYINRPIQIICSDLYFLHPINTTSTIFFKIPIWIC